MPASISILLSNVADGSGADGVMAGSGDLIKTDISAEFLKRGYQVYESSTSDVQQLIAEAKSRNASYALAVHITIWEENATSWSGKRDHAGITLQLYDVDSGALRATSERTANGVKHPNQCAPWLAHTGVSAMIGEHVDDDARPPC
jgi:hypothetical protein